MKGAVLALFCALALASAELNENGNPSKAADICAAEGSDGVLVAHENCNQFYKCSEGLPVALDCFGNLLFNPDNDQCDWPENVNCENSNTDSENNENGDNGNGDSSNEDNGSGDNGNGDNGSGDNGNEDNGSGDNGSGDMGNGDNGNGDNGSGDNGNEDNGSGDNGNEDNGSGDNGNGDNGNGDNGSGDNNNEDNGSGDNGSGDNGNGDNGNGDNGSGDNGNEDNGSGDNGNEDNGSGDNGNGNNGAGGNENPSEAPEICAAEGSDGVLVGHENCNQFYKCSEGLPVALDCYGNLLFNPSTDQCDWPENVNCKKRNTDSENNENGDNGNGDSSNEDNGSGDNGNGNKRAWGNGSDAPEICAAEGSDGVLVAHENCNQFYMCSKGLSVALDCIGNLFFNPDNDQCDWPANVNCENRNTDDENNEDGDNDNGNSSNEYSGNGNNGNGNNGAGGNENPSEAPEICAAEGSDGVLVAHENCNQFYKCSEGLPVALDCSSIFLFNPDNDQCDWPENVDCGNRNTLASFNKHLRLRM